MERWLCSAETLRQVTHVVGYAEVGYEELATIYVWYLLILINVIVKRKPVYYNTKCLPLLIILTSWYCWWNQVLFSSFFFLTQTDMLCHESVKLPETISPSSFGSEELCVIGSSRLILANKKKLYKFFWLNFIYMKFVFKCS